jgi:hypothetical protein
MPVISALDSAEILWILLLRFVAEAAEAPLIVGSGAMIKDSMSRMEKCFLIDKTNTYDIIDPTWIKYLNSQFGNSIAQH